MLASGEKADLYAAGSAVMSRDLGTPFGGVLVDVELLLV